tara:strand:- start:1122 stop:2222 length:1101 start_codon:yes stop_codon:yes gene_type:complete
MFKSFYKGKKVLVTGHTGFKGSWLICWLLKLGAKVYGYSDSSRTYPSHFNLLEIENEIIHRTGDIRDLEKLKQFIIEVQPDVVFHLAAQAIVSSSYTNPLLTISTNIVGTANLMESVRSLTKKTAVVLITSDKCYENKEWIWGYKETDRLGGNDIYSSSKASAELIIKSYLKSFFYESKNIFFGIARAGNVIGGGDWAKDRLVPDIYKAWAENKVVEIRSPYSTRPWQHVLEPLSGYLSLGQKLYDNKDLSEEPFNFGPSQNENKPVIELVEKLSNIWNLKDNNLKFKIIENPMFKESKLLKLNCDKALTILSWKANLDFSKTVQFVGNWYSSFYSKSDNVYNLTYNDINKYEQIAKSNSIPWAND